jgi:hypothetical protein
VCETLSVVAVALFLTLSINHHRSIFLAIVRIRWPGPELIFEQILVSETGRGTKKVLGTPILLYQSRIKISIFSKKIQKSFKIFSNFPKIFHRFSKDFPRFSKIFQKCQNFLEISKICKTLGTKKVLLTDFAPANFEFGLNKSR